MQIVIHTIVLLSLLLFSARPASMPQTETIHQAVLRGDTAAVANCIANDPASIEKKDANGRTPLHLACFRADEDMVRYLIERRADAGAVTNAGLTPLHWAVHSYEDTLRKQRIIETLLREAPETATVRDDKGITPLFWAAADSRISLETLMAHGSDINGRDNNGYTPLHHWTKWWVHDQSLWLLEHGADVNARDSCGRTPLHAAAVTGRRDRAEMLLAHGAEINAKDKDGKTPLDLAAWYFHPGLEAFLIGEGALYGSGNFREVMTIPAPDTHQPAGEAVVWYLENQGIAVTTGYHLLIFNYSNWGIPPETPSLANGHIVPEELCGYHTLIFQTGITGTDSTLLSWAGRDSLVRIIRPAGQLPAENCIVPQSWQSLTLDGVTITAVPATGGSVGYLTQVEGLTIFYGGELGLWKEEIRSFFLETIDAVHERAPHLDICFLNVCGGRAVSELPLTGITDAVSCLRPKVLFPIGGGGSWKFVYERVREHVEYAGLQSRVICFRDRGDRWCGVNSAGDH